MRRLLLAITFVLALPAVAFAQPGVRVLLVPSDNVPLRARRTVEHIISSDNVLISYEIYARAVAERRLNPSAQRALREIGTRQGANVIVVASYTGGRRRTLRLRYLNGRTGELVTSGVHRLVAQDLRAASRDEILRYLAAASGQTPSVRPPANDPPAQDEPAQDEPAQDEPAQDVPTEEAPAGDDGLPPPLDRDARQEAAATAAGAPDDVPTEETGSDGPGAEDEEEGRQWGFAAAVGAGLAHRTSTVPVEGRTIGLETSPFAAVHAQVNGYVLPVDRSRYRLSLAARYTTSVGLVAQEQRPDGSTRTTDLRSHHLSIGLRHDIPLAPGEISATLVIETGWAFRMLDSEIPISIPDYMLHGVFLRIGLFFPIGESPVSIGFLPEIGLAMSASGGLDQLAAVDDGFIGGAEAHVRVQIIGEVALQLLYREAHAFLGTRSGDEMSDAERYGIVRLEYVF